MGEAKAMLTKRERVQWRLIMILLRHYDRAGESMGRSRRAILLSATLKMSRLEPELADHDRLDGEIEKRGSRSLLWKELEEAFRLAPAQKRLYLFRWQGQFELRLVPDRWLAAELAWHHYLTYLADMARHDRSSQLPRDELRAAYWIWRLFPINPDLQYDAEELDREVRYRHIDRTILWMEQGGKTP